MSMPNKRSFIGEEFKLKIFKTQSFVSGSKGIRHNKGCIGRIHTTHSESKKVVILITGVSSSKLISKTLGLLQIGKTSLEVLA